MKPFLRILVVALGILLLGACADSDAGPDRVSLSRASRKGGVLSESEIRWMRGRRPSSSATCGTTTLQRRRAPGAAMVPGSTRSSARPGPRELSSSMPERRHAFYKDYPERRRAAEAPSASAPMEIMRRPYDPACEGPFPFDKTSGTAIASPPVRCPSVSLDAPASGDLIAPEDAISADGRRSGTSWSPRITNVLMTGVHANYCIVARSFGIRQMVMLKRPVLLVRDLTDSSTIRRTRRSCRTSANGTGDRAHRTVLVFLVLSSDVTAR